ncbi:MAG: hypothetical protein U9R53_11475 [Chloroflexota bacterium]|nr:hypothetical protein [Chloroflexota bacterium]
MNTSSDYRFEKPKIIQALLSGFNTIANKPYLILLPVLLDLFLWFGPAWRVDEYFSPLIHGMTNLPSIDNIGYSEILEAYQEYWQLIVTDFNLASSLRTLPIGVPSLMVSKSPFLNPLGQPLIFSLSTNLQVLGVSIIFVLSGYLLGSIYFKTISGQIIESTQDNDLKSYLKVFSQVILMPVLLIIMLLLISIPLLIIFTLITLISPTIGQFVLIIAGMFVLWVIMPLIFTPHCIFLYKQNLISAMMTSINVVKTSMGQTSMFIILSIVLMEGMDYLWRSPSVDNWFLFVGILGHAFMVTAVIASSFHYFIDATKFTQTVMNKKLESAK